MAELNDYEHRYRGLVFGPASTKIRAVAVDGLFDSNVRVSDRPIPRGDGAFRGEDFEDVKEIVVDLRIEGPWDPVTGPSVELIDRVAAVELAFQSRQSSDSELEFCYPGEGHRFVYARPIGRVRPRRWSTELGVVQMTVRFRAADPRIYGYEAKIETLRLYTNTSGLDYPEVQYPKDYGASGGFEAVATNDGNAEALPVFTFNGPTSGGVCESVKVTNRTNGQELEVVTDIAVGQILTADMDAEIRGTGVSPIVLSGTSRYGDWSTPGDALVLEPGDNVLRFEATGNTTGVVGSVQWRDTSK